MSDTTHNQQSQLNWYSEFKQSLKLKEVEELLDLFYFRPLAFLLVKAVYRTNIRPNHLTATAVLMGIIGGCFYSVGTPSSIIAGALFYMAFNIFDCSDGQLARLKKNGTPIGKILDGVGDWVATVAIYLGLAFGFANHQENPSFWWIMLSLTGLSNGIHGVIVDFYRNRFLDYYTLRKNNFEEGLRKYRQVYILAKQQKGKWFERTILIIYLKYCGFQRLLVARRKQSKTIEVSPQDYYKKNRIMMRLWLFIGPTSQISNLIICSLFHRIDLFVWIVLIGFNGLAVILWVIQKIIERTSKSIAE